MLHRTDEPHTTFDLAIIEHDAAGRNLHRGATRLAVDQKHRTEIGKTVERTVERERSIALTLGDREQAGLG